MLSKLLKNDLKKNMRWLWIVFAATIIVAVATRGCKELGENIIFFKILGIFFESVFYSLAVNVILQPFLRNFLNFSKSMYGDESYLTHTLPVTKNQVFKSKFLTAVIEIILGFATLIISIIIMYYSPTFFTTLKILISTIIVGKFSLSLTIALFVILVIVEFLMFITIIYFSIVIAYKTKEKRVLRTFLITAAISFAALIILSVILIAVLLINGVNLSTATLVLSSSSFISVIITGIIVYSLNIVLFYFLTKRELKRGVDVD